MKTSTIRSVIAVVIFAIAIPAVSVANTTRRFPRVPRNSAQQVDPQGLLWWLPADTESVVAARGPFLLPGDPAKSERESGADRFKSKTTQNEIRLAFGRLPFELFYALELETPAQGLIVAFAMQGSRHFRHPLAGSEVMQFEGCSIVVFENKSSELVGGLVKTTAKKASRTEIIAGALVQVFSKKFGDVELSLFLAAPRPNVLLAANNLQYLQEVLERMAQKISPRALADELPEWRSLDPAAQFWGLRHYSRAGANEDVTSPLNSKAKENFANPFGEDKAFASGDQQAVGILYALDPASERKAVITYFSGDEAKVRDAARVGTSISEPQAGVKYEVRLRNPKPGVLEHSYTLDRFSTLGYFILTVMIALGRGMYF